MNVGFKPSSAKLEIALPYTHCFEFLAFQVQKDR